MAKPLALGIDIGGTRLRAAILDIEGRVVSRQEMRTPAREGPQAVIAAIKRLVGSVSERLEGGASEGELIGVGICAPGPLDAAGGRALGVPTLAGWSDLPIRDMIAEALGLPAILCNDGVAAANGEWRFGAGKGRDNLVFVTVSTGVGGGVVADGRLVHGHKGMAGHVGHMTVMVDGALCSCGNRGCWEAYASGTALARRIGQRGAQLGLAPGAEAAELFAAARAGSPAAAAMVAEHGDYLGIGIAGLLHLYSPELVILGGGVTHGLDLMRPAIERRIARSAMPAFRAVPVVRAGLEENAGLVGVAALVFDAG